MFYLSVFRADVIHIVMFNLAFVKGRKYFDVADEILPWVEENWNLLRIVDVYKFISYKLLSSHLSTKCMVSYCDQSALVVVCPVHSHCH